MDRLSRTEEACGAYPGGWACLGILGLRLGECGLPLCQEAAVFGHAKAGVDLVRCAPGHERLPAETGGHTPHDLHSGPAGADGSHEGGRFLDGARPGIVVGGPPPGTPQERAGKNREWHGAVVAVVPVKKARLLVAMERIIRGVESRTISWGGVACASRNSSTSS